MENWQEDLLSEFLIVKNEYQLFEIVKSTASKLGFDYCAYGMQSPLSIAERLCCTKLFLRTPSAI